MHPDLEAIVAADAAARRDVDGMKRRLAEREALERTRLQTAREAAIASARAALEAEVRAIASAGQATIDARRIARKARSDDRRERAQKASASAVAAYVRIVRGEKPQGESS